MHLSVHTEHHAGGSPNGGPPSPKAHHYKGLILPSLGRLQLDELTREDIEEAFKVLATGGPASTNAKAPTKRKSFSVDQVDRLIAAAHEDRRYGALWITMLSAGLRPGEATGLARGDVDLDAAVVHVAHSLARVPSADGRQVLRPGPVKAGSERTVARPTNP